jgi:hypothetical protein
MPEVDRRIAGTHVRLLYRLAAAFDQFAERDRRVAASTAIERDFNDR